MHRPEVGGSRAQGDDLEFFHTLGGHIFLNTRDEFAELFTSEDRRNTHPRCPERGEKVLGRLLSPATRLDHVPLILRPLPLALLACDLWRACDPWPTWEGAAVANNPNLAEAGEKLAEPNLWRARPNFAQQNKEVKSAQSWQISAVNRQCSAKQAQLQPLPTITQFCLKTT